MQYRYFLSLGSNLGDRVENLRSAIRRIGAFGSVTAESSLYETAPVELLDQPDFLNMAVLLESHLTPEALLDGLLATEISLGRDRKAEVPKGPRLIDIDLVIAEEESGVPVTWNSPRLKVPHPRMAARRFVLAPLAEIMPELRFPGTGQTIRELLAESTGTVTCVGRLPS